MPIPVLKLSEFPSSVISNFCYNNLYKFTIILGFLMLRIIIISLLSISCHTISVVNKEHGKGGELLIEPSSLSNWQTESEDLMSRTCRYKGYKIKKKHIGDGEILIKFQCLKKK